MQFSNILLTLASMAMATAAPIVGNSSTVADVPGMGDWRTTFTLTDQPQKYCEYQGAVKIRTDLSNLEECKNLAFSFRNRNGYYTVSGWDSNKKLPNELVSWGTCHVRLSNVDNANTVYIGNKDLADLMDEMFKLRDDNKAGAIGQLGCKQARLGVSVMD